jgi:poly[(R)-3-hydroxyalkanoate] polymerase subunit PhaC
MNTFDPLDFAFRTGQELYKAGLLSMINGRRQSRGLPPVGWPSVATTAADVLWTDGNARLLHYRRDAVPPIATATNAKTPLLLVCSLINRPYVLDLLAERSVVRRLLERGHDVWLLDWGTPTSDDATRSLGSYALDQLPRAAEVVTRTAKSAQLHLLGYCMGGTLSLMAIAADRVPAASLVAMATPVALHDEGLLSLWCRAPGFQPAELADAYGNVPPHILQPAFKMLDPVSLATKFVHLDGKVEDADFLRFFLAMETWLEDSVAFPGRAFVDWVELYRSDALAGGKLVVDGTRIDLGRVRCPLFHVVAEGDYITPPPSSLALEKLAGAGTQETMRMSGGHIGLSTGRAAHERLWPAVSQFLHAHDAPAQKVSAPAKKSSAPAQQKLPTAARKVARPKSRDKRKR